MKGDLFTEHHNCEKREEMPWLWTTKEALEAQTGICNEDLCSREKEP